MDHPPSDLDLLKAELAELRQEVASLKAKQSEPITEPKKQVVTDDTVEADDEPGSNRRGFLRLAGAAAVGATAAAVVSGAEPAAALTGGNMLIATSNSATLPTDPPTRLFDPSGAQLQTRTFVADNYSSGGVPPYPSDHRIAVAGTAQGVDTVSSFRTGVYGRATNTVAGGQGVFGSSNGPQNGFTSGFDFGVVGTVPDGGFAVFGHAPVGAAAVGVLGRADEGIGVIASSFTGISLYVRNGGRILQDLRAPGAPAAGSFTVGEMIRDGVGDMYICTVSGSPGTWRKVTAQHPEFANAGGSVNLLPRPIRLIDSRGNGVPITNGNTRFAPLAVLEAQITGTVADSLSIPAGARGILGNLTATEALGSGFAVVWPTGQPQPATSNINFGVASSNPAIANYFISALDTNGKMNVMSAGAFTHLIVDVFGFVF